MRAYRCQVSPRRPEGRSDALHPPLREILVPPLPAGGKASGGAVVRLRPRARTGGQCQKQQSAEERQQGSSSSPPRRLHGRLLSPGFLWLERSEETGLTRPLCYDINGGVQASSPISLSPPLPLSLSAALAPRACPLPAEMPMLALPLREGLVRVWGYRHTPGQHRQMRRLRESYIYYCYYRLSFAFAMVPRLVEGVTLVIVLQRRSPTESETGAGGRQRGFDNS